MSTPAGGRSLRHLNYIGAGVIAIGYELLPFRPCAQELTKQRNLGAARNARRLHEISNWAVTESELRTRLRLLDHRHKSHLAKDAGHLFDARATFERLHSPDRAQSLLGKIRLVKFVQEFRLSALDKKATKRTQHLALATRKEQVCGIGQCEQNSGSTGAASRRPDSAHQATFFKHLQMLAHRLDVERDFLREFRDCSSPSALEGVEEGALAGIEEIKGTHLSFGQYGLRQFNNQGIFLENNLYGVVMSVLGVPELSAMTLDEVMANYPATMAVFNGFGVDSCCGSHRTVREAAALDGVDEGALLVALTQAVADQQ
jgi:regulator of cell morphogenesis and NO signaling